ncbi:FAD binding domain-containing protein [Microvirga lotononidis]|uniref:Aerobic-type carbon monoxide dehydrogenase, middle subunit CoxM/CutM-like protein n=1 Tax=Microvirga lotononidis TaxID=864069 RepID=I4YSW4_9HYPH|nr:xanthine dehydrogenase family protein subunit M [Microvirga lotononidis]EIM27056.1 aerobic-type carbon monoxide dehydrogenase, middle subunit CoxM/CutM-like protein [Microvirga lotononidis]WQO28755.1 xanthine dehydrogenase family protein subunit M [Microvirga lotononidis]
MRNFDYSRATSLEEAATLARRPGAMLLAGGTTLLDLAKCEVARPETVVDLTRLPGLNTITVGESGATIGALAPMSRVADDEGIRRHFPAIAESLLSAASAQLRNMATIGGNLLQRTRCPYFRDPAGFPACNKRAPGTGCSAIGGITRDHAVLGTSEHCIALYPGDLAVALTALGATVQTNMRAVPIEEFFLTPGETPERETVLEPGEIITAVAVPATPLAPNSTYLKVRDRQSYEFAAASAAVGIEIDPDGVTIRDIRIALGGVATKPWRAIAVEDALRGRILDEATIREASMAAIDGAQFHGGNAYKIELAPRVVARAILKAGGIQ